MKLKSFTFTLSLLGAMSLSSLSSAASGDSLVVGDSTILPRMVVGNSDVMASIFGFASGSYDQNKLPNADNQRIQLASGTRLAANAKIFGTNFTVVDLSTGGVGTREGSHMTGDTNAKITVADRVTFDRSAAFDLSTWDGADAPLARSQRVFALDKTFSGQFLVGPVPVFVYATVSGSVSVATNAEVQFHFSDGRHGSSLGNSSVSAQADLSGKLLAGVPALFAAGFTGSINLFTVSFPIIGVAEWDYSKAWPVEERNHYNSLALLAADGKTGGGSFGVELTGLLGIAHYDKTIASWNGFKVFDTDIKRRTSSDVGMYE